MSEIQSGNVHDAFGSRAQHFTLDDGKIAVFSGWSAGNQELRIKN